MSKLNRRDFIQKATGAIGATWAAGAVSLDSQPLAASPSPGAPAASEGASKPGAWFVRNDPSWVKKLSQPQYDFRFEFDVKKVPMRDGVILSANIWRPKVEGRLPVIYIHTPYSKSNSYGRAEFFARRGYIVVLIDCRGRYDSDGVHYMFWHTNWREGSFEGQDVYDSIAWIAKQPWCSGKIGMSGPSYLGYTQWLGAYLDPPNLTTIVPTVTLDDWHNYVYPGGAFRLAFCMHHLTILGDSRTNNDGLESGYYDTSQYGPGFYGHLPLRTLDKTMQGRSQQLWQDYIAHPDNDSYWRMSVGNIPSPGKMTAGKYPRVKVPSLNITGWYDALEKGTIDDYVGMVRYGPEALRSKHHLVVGPWEHPVGLRKVGDIDFGPEAAADSLPEDLRFTAYFLRPVELRWFDYWLKGIDNGIMDEPPVHIFTMGENAWRSEQEWPLSRAKETKYYLRSSGHANSRYGDGRLSMEPPGAEPADGFVYDPNDPVPTHGGTFPSFMGHGLFLDGPQDQRPVQGRNDVLVYTSEPMAGDLEVAGWLSCKLYAASTAVDTDFTGKLVDVHPNGYAQILKEGIIRARYRNSFERQELIQPGKVYEYIIDLWWLSYAFLKGHKIQVEISSSNFPLYDRNPNTGHKFGQDAELKKARQTVYHNSQYRSHLILPVVSQD